MTDNVESLILEHLRAIRADLANLAEKQEMTIQRLSSLERHVSTLHDDSVSVQMRLDRHEARLDRIEKRLDLVPAT